MKFLIALLIPAFLFCLPLQAEEVNVNSSAKIYNADINHAKEQALKNVLHEALKKAVGNLLDVKTINQNYEVIKNQIYRFNSKYIIDYEVLKENHNFNKNLYEIIITANVDDEKIRQKLVDVRILQKSLKKKRLLVLYHNRAPKSFPRENKAVASALDAAQQAFAEQSFSTFSEATLRQVYRSLEEENIVGRPVDSLIALALNYNADVLVIMGMNSRPLNKQQGTFYRVTAVVNFSVYDTASGQQIAQTNVKASELSVKKPSVLKRDILLGIAGKHASVENVRRTTEHINRFYQQTDEFGQGFSVIFRGYSPRRESLIIDYLENNTAFKKLSELKNTFGYLELELFALKRKSILRRKITSDLLELEIEVATKSIAGNNLFFINPNPMEEKEFEAEMPSVDNSSGI
ncbi:MAG: hypothetical protein VX545_07115 [SAR324 cluster bacterium]|jgi:hypothetical protein|nr:hypothetical protein [SAR324 cluster bacterium]MED5435728.1 hypothetical protein [SAR324 cluster bacterium]